MKLVLACYVFIFLSSLNLLAGDIYELKDGFNIRTSPSFGASKKNLAAYAGSGFRFEVINRTRANNGAEVLEIKPVNSSGNKSKLNIVRRSSKMFIFKKRNSSIFKLVTGSNDQPEADCPNGQCGQGANDNPRNLQQIGDVAGEINEQEEMASAPQFNGSYDALIKKYVSSKAVENMNKYALSMRTTKGAGYCLRGAKNVMQCGGKYKPCLMNYKLSANPAPDALRALNKTPGFVNLLDKEPYKTQLKADPSKAPKGTILIYSSGKPCSPIRNKRGKVVGYKFKDCGHAEVKVVDSKGNDFYVSDYKDDVPRPVAGGSRYKLIGAFIKDL